MADFRFTPSTATTTIPYWIDDNTTTPKGFWVRVSTLPAGSNDVYIYYGNIGASSNSNFNNAFPSSQYATNIAQGKTVNAQWTDGTNANLVDGNTETSYYGGGGSNGQNGWLNIDLDANYMVLKTRQYNGTTGYTSAVKDIGFGTGATVTTNFGINQYTISAIQWYEKTRTTMTCSLTENIGRYFRFTHVNTAGGGIGIVQWEWEVYGVLRANAEPTISSVDSEERESSFFSTGTFRSSVVDTASKIVVSSISWNPSAQPTGTNLAVGIRVSSHPFSINSSTPSWLTVSNGQNINWHGRYIQYQSTFTTTNSTTTPRLEDISITYRVKPWQEKSVTRTPPNSFGFGGGENWTWQVPVKGGQLVTISAYIRYNTEYLGGSYDKPKLTLSGLGINESISATSSAENSWELRQLSGMPSSDGILTLKAEGFSIAQGARFYIDDIVVGQ